MMKSLIMIMCLVILSAAKNLSWHTEILRCAQNDKKDG